MMLKAMVACVLLLMAAVADGQEWAAARIAGKVLDAEGKPLAGAHVVLNHATSALLDVSRSESLTARSDEAGRG